MIGRILQGKLLRGAIILGIGIFLGFISKPIKHNKNWFRYNWILILGLIELVYAIYLAFKINTNMVTLIITTISGIICLISSFHIQSIDFASQSIKSMSNNLKIDILEIKADNWKTEGVLVNALCTYIEILNIAPPTSYAYEYNLNKLVDVFEEMKKKGVEVNSLEASNLRKTFKNVPEEFSDIAKKILAAL